MATASLSTNETFALSSYKAIRPWLQQQHHRKQLALLDRFLQELRLNRRLAALSVAAPTSRARPSSAQVGAAPTSRTSAANTRLHGDRRIVIHRAVDLLRHMVGSTRWENAAQLMLLLRGLGRELQEAVGYTQEPAMGNIIRRIMASVREEVVRLESNPVPATISSSKEGGASNSLQSTMNSTLASGGPAAGIGGRLSLQSLLWALPPPPRSIRSSSSTTSHHGRSSSSASLMGTGTDSHPRQESLSDFDCVTDTGATEFPAAYYAIRPDLKSSIMEAMDEINSELEDLHKNINDQAIHHIHSGEVVLTYGRSKTVELFLRAAATKKRRFQVIVCESAPYYGGHDMADALAELGIPVMVVHDSAIFAVMVRVHKVLLPAHAVLANGGLVASSGCNLVALAAQHHAVPVVCLTGLFKLCPIFPHEGQDTLNDLISPSVVMDYAELRNQGLDHVELVNPVHDYIKPSCLDLYITNVGSFQPSYIYRLLAEYYHSDDWAPFD